MSYGYGRNDPDNWETGPYGKPIDPDWESSATRAASSVQRAPTEAPKPRPLNLYGAIVECSDAYGHMLLGNSGEGFCSRCGFRWHRLHTMLGHVVVGTGAIVIALGTARTSAKVGDRLGDGT